MINPVFVRLRDDKQVQRPDVRFEQVSDLVRTRRTAKISKVMVPTRRTARRRGPPPTVLVRQKDDVQAALSFAAWRAEEVELSLP
jgi:hypothetical protein